MQLYFIRHAESENNALYNRSANWAGRSPDPDLTATGREQARRLAEFLAGRRNGLVETARHDPRNANGFNLTHLYCSPMVRALLTGQAVAETLGLPLVVWEELHERGGIFELDPESDERTGLPGATVSELQAGFPLAHFPENWGRQGWWNRPAETGEEQYERACRLVERIRRLRSASHVATASPFDDDEEVENAATNDGEELRIALFSHGGFYQAFLHALFADALGREEVELVEPFWFSLNNTAITRIDFRERGMALVYSNRLDHLPPELVTS